MHRYLALALPALALAFLWSCSDDAATGAPPAAGGSGGGTSGACVADGDCGSSELCLDSTCVTRDGEVCAEDAHCDLGEHCDASARACRPGTACTGNADCRRGDSCQDGGCVPDPREACTDDSECRPGQVCIDLFCEQDGAGGAGGTDCLSYTPPVVEDPGDEASLRGTLVFGSAPNLGDVRVVEVTVTNTCERGVTIRQAARESATSAEFAVAPDRSLPAMLARGEQLTITVTYAPVDYEEERTGQFVAISSDDLHPTATYELQVEYKGTSVLALTEDVAAEEPLVSAWNFGAVAVGQSGAKTLFLKNAGNGNHLLHLSSISTTSGTPFSVAPAVDQSREPLVLPPFRGCLVDGDCAAGQTCDTASGGACVREDGTFADVVPLVVTFTPIGARPETATLILVHDAGGVGALPDQRHEVVLAGGGGVPPMLVLTPASFDFGEVEVDTSVTRTLRLQNAGDQDLVVSNLRMAGLSSPEFTFDPPALPSIPAGNFQTLTVQYAPVGPAIGSDIGAIELDTNDPASPTVTVQLTGVSTNPSAFVSPLSLDLGQAWPGDPPNTGRITIRNAGFGNLRIDSITVTAGSDPGFTIPNPPPFPFDIPDASVQLDVDVAFAPLAPGLRSGAVEIVTSDADSPLVQVSLAGEGLDCSCTLPGASFTCDRGTCLFGACLPGFVDLDGLPATGCEYFCTPTGAMFDPPDDGFVDEDCDGVDGMAASAIFVSADGADSNPGTRALPKATVSAAILAAEQQGFDVYVAGGTYVESSTVALADGVSIFGAYSATDWSRSDQNVTEVVGPATAMSATNLASETILDHLRITGGNNVTPGGSAYGIFASFSSGLVVRRSIVSAGRGGDGQAGASQAGRASDGDPGQQGEGGCEESGGLCSGCSQPQGGPPGTNPADSGAIAACAGSAGGRGGNAARSGSTGNPGDASPGGAAGGPGTPPRQGNWDTPPQYWGADGADGGPGTSGLPGIPTYLGTGYLPAPGGGGAAGRPGVGGGGGGGGGGGESNCDSYGGGGGGGGAAGCGGIGAGGGTSAGGSFAIWLWASSARIEYSELRTAGGGAGGPGGTGQQGGVGADGGHGVLTGAGNTYTSSSEQDDGSNGGRGGRGGAGGAGGFGGGGAGGPSVGLLVGGGSAPTLTSNTFGLGPGGGGGPSGGNAGPDGAQADTLTP